MKGLLLAAAAALAGCGEEDLCSVRMRLRGDGAGEMLMSRVRLSGLPEDVARISAGLAWEAESAAVELVGASFDDIDKVRLAGIGFSLEDRPKSFLFRARIPMGKGARWPGFLSPIEGRETLKKLAARAKELPDLGRGPVYKLQVELPGEVVRQSLKPKVGEEAGLVSFIGVRTGGRAGTAYLLLPLREVRGMEGPELVWTVEAR